jgi:predicted O-methyltransferase YrrM
MKPKDQIIARMLRVTEKITDFILWLPYSVLIYLRGTSNCFDIFTHLTRKERLLLYKLALSLPQNCTALEVGSYLGASACFLASGVKERHGRVFCVDTWKNEEMSEGLRDTFSEFQANVKPYEDVIIALRGKSDNVAEEFNEGIDLLFIDGGHSYEAVKADVEAWFPKLNVNAIVIFHDYQWAEGVQRVVDERVRPLSQDGGNSFHNTYWTRIGNSSSA